MTNLKSQTNFETFELFVDKSNNAVILTFHGIVRLKDLISALSATVYHPDFVKNMGACYDLRQAVVEVDLNETEIFSHFAAGMREKRGESYQLVFVYGDQMTKMLAEFYRLFLARTDVDVYIVNDIKKAINWLVCP